MSKINKTNNLNKHKKADGVKWFFTAMTFILVFVMITGISLEVFGTGKMKPSEWFQSDQEATTPQKQSGGAILNAPIENGVNLMSANIPAADFAAKGISKAAETAYTITATIKPETAENKSINWSIDFVNASSSWAQGKTVTDYVTISTDATQSGESVTVTCLKDFGESIKIAAVSASDETVKATCSVEYIKKVVGISYTFKYNDASVGSVTADSDGVYRFDYTGEAKAYVFTPVPEYSAYTIDTTYEVTVNGKYSDNFGYGSGVSLNTASLLAGLSDVAFENDPSAEAEAYINQIGATVNLGGNVNGFIGSLSTADSKYDKLSETDKKHSKVVNAYEAHQVLKTAVSSGRIDPSKLDQAKSILSSYAPPAASGGFMGGVNIPSVDALLQAAKVCNEAQKGIVEYTVTFTSDDLTYSSKISLGYTTSSLNAVREVEVSALSIIF